MFHARVCVCMLTALKRAKKPDEVCFVICCTSTTWLYSLSFPLALSCVSGSCSLLLQVLIINDWDIKKPKKQFLLRFFDSHRVAFDSLLFFFFLFSFFGTCCTSFKRWFFSLFLTVLDSYLICKKRLINNCLDGSKSSKYYYVLITHYNNGEI